jgi:hypothetical protein
LGAAGKSLWRAITGQWAGDGLVPDQREVRLLADACAEADVLAQLQAELAAAAAGELTVKGSTGQPVVHPLVDQCRRSRALIASLLSKLGFDDPASMPRSGRGARTTSTQARAAAQVRHGGVL